MKPAESTYEEAMDGEQGVLRLLDDVVSFASELCVPMTMNTSQGSSQIARAWVCICTWSTRRSGRDGEGHTAYRTHTRNALYVYIPGNIRRRECS